MKKNEYVAPAMEIVEITEQTHLLEGSGGGANNGTGGSSDGRPHLSRTQEDFED